MDDDQNGRNSERNCLSGSATRRKRSTPDPADHTKIVAEDVARPVLYHNRSGTCWQSYVKGYTPMVNSIYNGMRMEEVWLDR